MYTIKAKQLTAEAFRKYGTYQNLLDNEEMKKILFSRKTFLRI